MCVYCLCIDYTDLAMYSTNLYNASIITFYSKKEQNIIICDLLYDLRTPLSVQVK